MNVTIIVVVVVIDIVVTIDVVICVVAAIVVDWGQLCTSTPESKSVISVEGEPCIPGPLYKAHVYVPSRGSSR